MTKPLATTLFAGIIAIATSAHAFASESVDTEATFNDDQVVTIVVAENEEQISVDSRPLSPELKEQMEKKRESENQQCENIINEGENALDEPFSDEEQLDVASLKIPIKMNSLAGLMIPIKTHNYDEIGQSQYLATATTFSPYIYHWIQSMPKSNIIKLEDGSEWILDQDYAGSVRNWSPNDPLIITPKSQTLWSSNYSYVLTNTELNCSIDVNPFNGPIKCGPYTTWVVGINRQQGQVYLRSGQGERTVWEISSADSYLFDKWHANDTIIIGQNDSWLWWFSPFNHIIINVNMNHYVRARPLSPSVQFTVPTGG